MHGTGKVECLLVPGMCMCVLCGKEKGGGGGGGGEGGWRTDF